MTGKEFVILFLTQKYLTDNNIFHEFIDEKLVVRQSLNLSNELIEYLPEKLTVNRSLILDNSIVSSLPEKLRVGENLSLENTDILELPNTIRVGGNMYISNTNITSLDGDIIVGGDLIMTNSYVNYIPESLKVKGCIYKNGYISNIRHMVVDGKPIAVMSIERYGNYICYNCKLSKYFNGKLIGNDCYALQFNGKIAFGVTPKDALNNLQQKNI